MGHRRLAIIDLDARSAQPMHSLCGRYVIVFNGEIYNYRELRRRLEDEGSEFRTESDTEVLLALYAKYGQTMLERLKGMFAFVIWDKQSRRAFAARDPYGIKPLYLARIRGGWLIGSQVKALLATGLVGRDPDLFGQAGYWMLGSVPEPHTWYESIKAIRAGYAIELGVEQTPRESCWRDIGAMWRDAGSRQGGQEFSVDYGEHVREALRESVSRHMVADVPVGVFLSGGVDSGAIAGLMTNQRSSLQGVTLQYAEYRGGREDEAPLAAMLARHYGIEHRVRTVTAEEFQADLSQVLDDMDQPSIDGVNTWYASKAVAELNVKVVVSGVGGDELFQGYSHFRTIPRLLRWRRRLAWLPVEASALRAAGQLQAWRSKNKRWQHIEPWTRTIEGAWWLRRSVRAPEELSVVMGRDAAACAMKDFDPVEMVRRMTGPLSLETSLAIGQIESMTYLRNQLLRDSDWASMAHGVELRTPLVDATLLSNMQPVLLGLKSMSGKRLLARSPKPALPDGILRRRKTGFGIPLREWLRDKGLSVQSGWGQLVAAGCYEATQRCSGGRMSA